MVGDTADRLALAVDRPRRGGFGGYLFLNYRLTGDFFAFSKIMEQNWYKKLEPPWVGVHDVWLRIFGVNLAEGFHEFFYIVLSFVCTVWCWIRPAPILRALDDAELAAHQQHVLRAQRASLHAGAVPDFHPLC
jgi:hypothetical protein